MPEILLSKIKMGIRFRSEPGDIKALAESIQEIGLLHPIVLDEENKLIAGGRRISAVRSLGWKSIPYTVISIDDNKIGEFHENAVRKDFTYSEIAEITEYVEKTRIGHRPKKGSDSGTLPKGSTDDVVSRLTGISHDTISKIKKINSVDPEILQKIDEKKGSVNKAYNNIIIAENKKLPKISIPKGQYNLVVYDPSWPHDNEIAGGSGKSGNAQKYRPESIQEMMNHEMKKNLAKDCILAIWTLPTFHDEVLQVVKAWGFEKIRTKMYWDKMQMSMGFNFRNQVEELCICTKGKAMAFHMTKQTNIIHQKPNGIHSRKPDIFYKILVDAARNSMPRFKLSKAELNATKPREGWVTIGNQIKDEKKEDLNKVGYGKKRWPQGAKCEACKLCKQRHLDHNYSAKECMCKCHNHIILKIKFSHEEKNNCWADHHAGPGITWQGGTIYCPNKEEHIEYHVNRLEKDYNRPVIVKIVDELRGSMG